MTGILEATDTILAVTIIVCSVGIAISLALILYRIIAGPSQADRAIALDAVGINLMGLAGFVAISLVTTKLNDVILLLGILAFLGTLAIAKYLEKGVIIDRDMD